MAVAAGLRHPSSGALTNVFDKPRAELCLHELCRGEKTCMNMNVGTWGAYYGSSSFAAGNPNASHLAFGSGEVNPLNTANRANALSVRCVQHLRLLFIFLRAGSPGRNGRNVFPKVAGSQIVGKYLAGKRN